MKDNEIVTGFSSCTTEQFSQLRTMLGLTMQTDALAFCAAYYREQKNEPTVGELRMLDRLSAYLETTPQTAAISDFCTNDRDIAETYADLLRKRQELCGSLKHPITLPEAAETLGKALERGGKKASLCNLPVPEDTDPDGIRVSPRLSVTVAGSSQRMYFSPAGSPEKGDRLILISKPAELSVPQYKKRLSAFFTSENTAPLMKKQFAVRTCGILPDLLELFDGMNIDLSRLSPYGFFAPLTSLVTESPFSRVLCVGAENADTIVREASEAGFSATIFAMLVSESFITVRAGENEFPRFSCKFLKTLFHYRAVAANLTDEAENEADRVTFSPVTDGVCAYLPRGTTEGRCESVAFGGMTVSAAAAKTGNAFFRTALYTSLLPLLALSLSGADYSRQFFSGALEIPDLCRDSTAVGDAMAAILGIYRLQAELGLSSGSMKMRVRPELEHPAVTAFAMAEASPCPAGFKTAGNRVYRFPITVGENGLPDFAALRSAMDQLCALRRKRTLVSATVLYRETLADGIRRMSGSLGCDVRDTSCLFSEIPLAVLFESREELTYEEIGTVRENEQTEDAREDAPCLIRSEIPAVTILANDSDPDAPVLASVLTANGADVRVFTEKTEDGLLASSILSSQTFLICKGAALPEDEFFRRALEFFHRANGTVCVLGEDACDLADAVVMRDGLSPAFFRKIIEK